MRSLEDLEVTSVTAIEVTSIVFLFYSNQWRTWCTVVLKNEPVHSLLRIDKTITNGSTCVFHIPCRVHPSKQLWWWTSFHGTSTNEFIKDVKDNQWIYLPRPDWSFNRRPIWTNIGLGAFFLTPSISISIKCFFLRKSSL